MQIVSYSLQYIHPMTSIEAATTMGTTASDSVSDSENVAMAMAMATAAASESQQSSSQPQAQDNLRIFLRHLYAECVYRYQNDTYDDPSVSVGGAAAATGEWRPLWRIRDLPHATRNKRASAEEIGENWRGKKGN